MEEWNNKTIAILSKRDLTYGTYMNGVLYNCTLGDIYTSEDMRISTTGSWRLSEVRSDYIDTGWPKANRNGFLIIIDQKVAYAQKGERLRTLYDIKEIISIWLKTITTLENATGSTILDRAEYGLI